MSNKLFCIEQIESGSVINRVTVNGSELPSVIRRIKNTLIRAGYSVYGSIREGFVARRYDESIILEIEAF